MAAYQAVDVAITVSKMAAAEGRFRTVIELVVDTAMVRTIRTARKILVGAMITESGRQGLRYLPIHADREATRRRNLRCARKTGRVPPDAGEKNECQGFQYESVFHHASVIAAESIGDRSFVDAAM